MLSSNENSEQNQKRAKICNQNIPAATFEKIQKLTAKQLADLFPRFPESVQESLNKAERGDLEFVSSEELEKLTKNYLFQSLEQNELTTPLEGFEYTNYQEKEIKDE